MSPRHLFILLAAFLFLTSVGHALPAKQTAHHHSKNSLSAFRSENSANNSFDFFFDAIDDNDDDDDVVCGKKRASRFFSIYEASTIFFCYSFTETFACPRKAPIKDLHFLSGTTLNKNTCLRI